MHISLLRYLIRLKAVNGYQKRPNETMQLIMWIEFCPARDVWSLTGTFGRPEDNVRDSGTEDQTRTGWSACISLN